MTTGERMRARRKELGFSADHVAEQLDVSRSTIFRYENGDIEKLPIDALVPLAQVLRTTPAYLMGWSIDHEKEIGTPYNPTHRIPILGRISAGLPLYAEEHVEGYTYTELNHSAEYFGLRVDGDSMNAVNIHEGNILIVRRQPVVDNGDIAVVLVDGENATVKQFYQNGKMVTLVPKSINPDHQIQMYDLNDTPIQVLGKVVENKIMFE